MSRERRGAGRGAPATIATKYEPRAARGDGAPQASGVERGEGPPRLIMKSGLVSLIGRPNAGKSSLMNRIVGEKLAIVSDKPQTTRTRIIGVKNYPEGQVVFVDTPGIHRPLHRMN